MSAIPVNMCVGCVAPRFSSVSGPICLYSWHVRALVDRVALRVAEWGRPAERRSGLLYGCGTLSRLLQSQYEIAPNEVAELKLVHHLAERLKVRDTARLVLDAHAWLG